MRVLYKIGRYSYSVTGGNEKKNGNRCNIPNTPTNRQTYQKDIKANGLSNNSKFTTNKINERLITINNCEQIVDAEMAQHTTETENECGT